MFAEHPTSGAPVPQSVRRRFASTASNGAQSLIRETTRLVEAVGGINLGQGTCPLPPHHRVVEAAHRALDSGHHSYTSCDGIPFLKAAVAERYAAYNHVSLRPEEVLITQGATGGLESACKTFLDPGDECILFAPVYEYHQRLVRQRGAIPKFVTLRNRRWEFDPAELEQLFTERTKLVILANPNNPTGKVFTVEELRTIGETARRHGSIVVVDEVYEYLILTQHTRHASLASLPGMFDHTLTLSSASKTFFCTGWRVGWCTGPADVLERVRVKSDETYVCAPAPLQHAVADALRLGEEFFASIPRPFIAKCDRLCRTLASAGLMPTVPDGAYYVLASHAALGCSSDVEAMSRLISRVGVGSIPGCAFTADGSDLGLLRFCFAVEDDVLDRACSRLLQL